MYVLLSDLLSPLLGATSEDMCVLYLAHRIFI